MSPLIDGFQTRDKVAILVDQTIQKCLRRICIKIEFSSQQRENLLLWSTNMAAVTSRVKDIFLGSLLGIALRVLTAQYFKRI